MTGTSGPVASVPRAAPRRRAPLGLVLAALPVLVMAVNLRPALASVGPVLPEIGADLGLGSWQLAVLTAGPVFCMGLFAATASGLVRRAGLRAAVVVVLATIGAGLLVRLGPGLALLFAGTLVAAVGIAVGNVLVPTLVREEHPDRVGPLMGLYTVALAGSASVASAASVPLAQYSDLGWRAALGPWALLALVAAVASAPRARRQRAPGTTVRARPGGLGRSRLAWSVTGYFALQSLSFYTTLTWLAPILRDGGTSATRAGLLVSLLTLVQLPASLAVPLVASRRSSQRPLVVLVCVVSVLGLSGLLLAPGHLPVLWVGLLGLGQGAGFALALTLLVLRTSTPADTTALSAMTQSVGYTCAGLGPLAAGALHDLLGTWSVPLALLLALLVLQLLPGLVAAGPGVVRRSGSGAGPGGGAPVGTVLEP